MNDETKHGEGEPEPKVETIKRRDFLLGLGKWSSAVIGGVLLLGQNDSAKAGGAWVNRRGGWVNGAVAKGGGGAWVNGGGGGGGGWVNRAGAGGAWVNGGGGGGAGWVNRRGAGGAGWVNR